MPAFLVAAKNIKFAPHARRDMHPEATTMLLSRRGTMLALAAQLVALLLTQTSSPTSAAAAWATTATQQQQVAASTAGWSRRSASSATTFVGPILSPGLDVRSRRSRRRLSNGDDVPAAEEEQDEDEANGIAGFLSSSGSRRRWLFGIGNAVATSVVATTTSASSAIAATGASTAIVSTAATCDPSVSVWKRQNRIVYLLGTAHISSISADLAGQLVRDTHPQAVFIELDLKRIGGLATATLPYSKESLKGGGDGTAAAANSKILVPAVSAGPTAIPATASAAVTTSTSGPMVPAGEEDVGVAGRMRRDAAVGFGAQAVGSALRGMYKNLNKAGFKPGEEFLYAVREGRAIGADIVLGDRDVEVTLRRLTEALAVTDLKKLMDPNNELEQSMRELLPGGGQPPPLVPATGQDPDSYKDELSTFVESIKSRDRVRKIMGQLNQLAPALVKVMLTERDAYMAAGLDTLNQYTVIVAVMGIAHLDGVERNLQSLGWKQGKPRC